MKRIRAAVSLFGALTVAVFSAEGQAFVNLDFEDAYVQQNDPYFGFLDWGLAAPGWGHSSGQDTGILYYQHGHLSNSQIYWLIDSTSPALAPGALDGYYSVAFASGYATSINYPPGPWTTAFISQTGSIPGGMKSIQLLATGPFSVSVGGVNVPMVSLGGNLYGGDITGFAGTTAELKIMNTAPVGYAQVLTTVDDITFSTMAVPEPSTMTLAGLGGLVFLRKGSGRIRRRQRL
jgi:hypothetical protein